MSASAFTAIPRDIRQEAMAWETRLACGRLSRAENAEFLQWMQRSPQHVKAYLLNAQRLLMLAKLLKA